MEQEPPPTKFGFYNDPGKKGYTVATSFAQLIEQKIPDFKGKTQKKLVQEINVKDMVFAIGPAGTGKTYTAVAMAVRALKAKEVKRIVLTRPAVEALNHLTTLNCQLNSQTKN